MFDKIAEDIIEEESLRCTGLGGTHLWSLPQIYFLCVLFHVGKAENMLRVCVCVCVCVCV